MLILFEYPNNKKTFYTIYEHHYLVNKLQTCGVMSHEEGGQDCKFKKYSVRNLFRLKGLCKWSQSRGQAVAATLP